MRRNHVAGGTGSLRKSSMTKQRCGEVGSPSWCAGSGLKCRRISTPGRWLNLIALSSVTLTCQALKTCLDRLAQLARERNATVHMPRIGCGQAGGNWNMVSEMITYLLCERGIKVTVYDLPGTEFVEKHPTLF